MYKYIHVYVNILDIVYIQYIDILCLVHYVLRFTTQVYAHMNTYEKVIYNNTLLSLLRTHIHMHVHRHDIHKSINISPYITLDALSSYYGTYVYHHISVDLQISIHITYFNFENICSNW